MSVLKSAYNQLFLNWTQAGGLRALPGWGTVVGTAKTYLKGTVELNLPTFYT